MNYRFHRAALAEHLDEVVFYEGRLPGLGADYLAEFGAVMARTCATPEFYRALIIPASAKPGSSAFHFT